MGILPPRIRWYDWRSYRAMYRSRGAWYPSMGVLASLAVLLLSTVGDPFSRVVTTVWLSTIVLVCVLFGVALVGASVRAVRALLRTGIRGWTRPRWWFEWANLAWSLLVLVILVVAPLAALAPKVGLGPWGDIVFRQGGMAAMVLFWIFMVASAAGYVVSVLAGRPKTGNAYACVQFAFPVIGGIVLVTIAGVNWPAGGVRPPPTMILLGAFGGAIMILGFWDLMHTNNRVRSRRHPGGIA